MAGIDRNVGTELGDWPHVAQSIGVILTTPVGSRVMRRDFGSDIPALLDRPLNRATILDAMVAAADALDHFEPRFRLERIEVGGGAEGRLALILSGVYRPRGHLGDFTPADRQVLTVAARAGPVLLEPLA